MPILALRIAGETKKELSKAQDIVKDQIMDDANAPLTYPGKPANIEDYDSLHVTLATFNRLPRDPNGNFEPPRYDNTLKQIVTSLNATHFPDELHFSQNGQFLNNDFCPASIIPLNEEDNQTMLSFVNNYNSALADNLKLPVYDPFVSHVSICTDRGAAYVKPFKGEARSLPIANLESDKLTTPMQNIVFEERGDILELFIRTENGYILSDIYRELKGELNNPVAIDQDLLKAIQTELDNNITTISEERLIQLKNQIKTPSENFFDNLTIDTGASKVTINDNQSFNSVEKNILENITKEALNPTNPLDMGLIIRVLPKEEREVYAAKTSFFVNHFENILINAVRNTTLKNKDSLMDKIRLCMEAICNQVDRIIKNEFLKITSSYEYGKDNLSRCHSSPAQSDRLDNRYQGKTGDVLKRAILEDFKDMIALCKNNQELHTLQESLKNSNEYKVLETPQRPFASIGKTSSVEAFNQLIIDAQTQINKLNPVNLAKGKLHDMKNEEAKDEAASKFMFNRQ